MSETFIGQYKKGDMFQFESVWYVAESDGVYQDAYQAEEGFDVFLSHSDYYTECRKATLVEVQEHLTALAEKHAAQLAIAAHFHVGQHACRKGSTSGKIATILEIDVERGSFRYLFDGAKEDHWTPATAFEAMQ